MKNKSIKFFQKFKSIFLIILLWFIFYLLLRFCFHMNLSNNDFILFITFIALIYYTYYNYKIYRQDLILSASVKLISAEDQKKYEPLGTVHENHEFRVIMQNFTKYPLKCRCIIKSVVFGKLYETNDFYGGKEYRTIQPFGIFNGWIDIDRYLKLAGESYKDIYYNKKNNYGDDEILKFDVDFEYSLANGDELTKNPTLNYFYIFRQRSLSLY
ncbi:MAG: hypothetical protein V1779_16885 [bacterium]